MNGILGLTTRDIPLKRRRILWHARRELAGPNLVSGRLVCRSPRGMPGYSFQPGFRLRSSSFLTFLSIIFPQAAGKTGPVYYLSGCTVLCWALVIHHVSLLSLAARESLDRCVYLIPCRLPFSDSAGTLHVFFVAYTNLLSIF